ncbi:MAG: GntR family transcriptional regulator [Lachnospiraceae bacterium]|nr:GntR family transcriptional regulator [Lachnospiraceae bacterium]
MNEFLPLREVVFLTLRGEILRGELSPGERLMEIALAEKLGVSRTPIREAIRMLEREGLVVMKPRRGAQVAKISVQELNDVLEIRKCLETLATRKVCERMEKEELERMREAAAVFENLVASEQEDLAALAEADVNFHDTIYQGAGNRRLIQMLGNLREQMYRFRIEYLKEKDVRRKLADEHKRILDAVAARNSEEAVRLIEEHIDQQHQMIVESILEKEEGYVPC